MTQRQQEDVQLRVVSPTRQPYRRDWICYESPLACYDALSAGLIIFLEITYAKMNNCFEINKPQVLRMTTLLSSFQVPKPFAASPNSACVLAS